MRRADIERWVRSRNDCPTDKIHRVDAEGAETCGFHVLAALLRLRDDLERARGPMDGVVVVAYLAPIIALARGDAQDHARQVLRDASVEVPGIVSFRR